MIIDNKQLIEENDLAKIKKHVFDRLAASCLSAVEKIVIERSLKDCHYDLVNYGSIAVIKSASAGYSKSTVKWNKSVDKPQIEIILYREIQL